MPFCNLIVDTKTKDLKCLGGEAKIIYFGDVFCEPKDKDKFLYHEIRIENHDFIVPKVQKPYNSLNLVFRRPIILWPVRKMSLVHCLKHHSEPEVYPVYVAFTHSATAATLPKLQKHVRRHFDDYTDLANETLRELQDTNDFLNVKLQHLRTKEAQKHQANLKQLDRRGTVIQIREKSIQSRLIKLFQRGVKDSDVFKRLKARRKELSELYLKTMNVAFEAERRYKKELPEKEEALREKFVPLFEVKPLPRFPLPPVPLFSTESSSKK
jgi:hypothetical protein